MSSSRWADELAFTIDLARRAGGVLTASYERLERIDYKSKRDVVTDADYASEHLVIDAIKSRYPDDAILAEESGEHAGVRRDDGSHNGRTWVIDPLDGTVNYANGIPFYCVSIGLVVDDRPAVGVVLDPARDDLYSATADGAARLGDEPIRASTKEALSDYVVSLAVIGSGGLMRERRIAPTHPHPSAHGERRAGAGLCRERSVRRVRPERRPVAVGRRRRRAHRRAGRARW